MKFVRLWLSLVLLFILTNSILSLLSSWRITENYHKIKNLEHGEWLNPETNFRYIHLYSAKNPKILPSLIETEKKLVPERYLIIIRGEIV